MSGRLEEQVERTNQPPSCIGHLEDSAFFGEGSLTKNVNVPTNQLYWPRSNLLKKPRNNDTRIELLAENHRPAADVLDSLCLGVQPQISCNPKCCAWSNAIHRLFEALTSLACGLVAEKQPKPKTFKMTKSFLVNAFPVIATLQLLATFASGTPPMLCF